MIKRGISFRETDPKNNTIQYNYDALNRQTEIIEPESNNTTTFEYDFFGNKRRTVDARHKETLYSYNKFNKLTGVTDAGNHTTQYFYDRVGNMTRMERPGQSGNLVTTYTYDELGRLTGVLDSLNQWTKYDYDGAGNKTYTLDPNGNTGTYQYNSDNTLNRLTVVSGSEAKRLVYTYDNANQAGSISQTKITNYGLPNETTATESSIAWNYLPQGQVIQETRGGIPGHGNLSVGYRYDELGGLTGMLYPGTSTVVRL